MIVSNCGLTLSMKVDLHDDSIDLVLKYCVWRKRESREQETKKTLQNIGFHNYFYPTVSTFDEKNGQDRSMNLYMK